jgi:hypothetical protein
MRKHVTITALFAFACGFTGCTSAQLRTSTVRQAQTLTGTQYQQVLDKLAMFCLEPDALPSLLSLKSGAPQVGDTGQLGFLGVAGIDTKFGSSPTIAASRSIVDQWGTAPVTDDNVLKLVRMGYQNAVGKVRWLTEEEANEFGHDLSQQIGTNADISTNLEMLKVLAGVHGEGLKEARPPQGGRGGGGSSGGIEPIPGAFRAVPYTEKVASDLIKLDQQLVDTLDENFLVYKYTQDGTPPVPFPRFEIRGRRPSPKPDAAANQLEAEKVEAVRRTLERNGLSQKYEITRTDVLPSTGLAKETRRQVNDIQEGARLDREASSALVPRRLQEGLAEGRVLRGTCEVVWARRIRLGIPRRAFGSGRIHAQHSESIYHVQGSPGHDSPRWDTVFARLLSTPRRAIDRFGPRSLFGSARGDGLRLSWPGPASRLSFVLRAVGHNASNSPSQS